MYNKYCDGVIHVVEKGDTLYELSKRYNVPLSHILNANPYIDVYNMGIGMRICIPMKKIRPDRPGDMDRWTNAGPDRWPDARPGMGMPGMGRPDMDDMNGRPGMGMPDMDDMNGRPGMGMPGMDDMNGRPGMGMPGMDDMNGRPGMEMPGMDDMNGRSGMEMPVDEFNGRPEVRFPLMGVPGQSIPEMEMPGMEMQEIENRRDMKKFAYIVKEGDSLQDIMDKFGVGMDEILEYNEMNDMMPKPGTTIILPLEE